MRLYKISDLKKYKLKGGCPVMIPISFLLSSFYVLDQISKRDTRRVRIDCRERMEIIAKYGLPYLVMDDASKR